MKTHNKNDELEADFSWMSPFYDLLGLIFFAGNLHRSQTALLTLVPEKPESVLILGGGTGKFLVELIKGLSPGRVTYIDISQGMIDKAQNKVKKIKYDQAKINFICGTLKNAPQQKYDLVITHYFLDCFSQNNFISTANDIKKRLKEGGYWSMVDFHEDEASATWHKNLIRLLYYFFRKTCGLKVKELPDFDAWFMENLKEVNSQFFCKKILKSSLYKKI